MEPLKHVGIKLQCVVKCWIWNTEHIGVTKNHKQIVFVPEFPSNFRSMALPKHGIIKFKNLLKVQQKPLLSEEGIKKGKDRPFSSTFSDKKKPARTQPAPTFT